MNTLQEEEEIKNIPEGAKCKLHVGLYNISVICSQELKDKLSQLLQTGKLFRSREEKEAHIFYSHCEHLGRISPGKKT